MAKLSGDSPDFSSKKLASQASNILCSFIRLLDCWLCLDQFVCSSWSRSLACFRFDWGAEFPSPATLFLLAAPLLLLLLAAAASCFDEDVDDDDEKRNLLAMLAPPPPAGLLGVVDSASLAIMLSPLEISYNNNSNNNLSAHLL